MIKLSAASALTLLLLPSHLPLEYVQAAPIPAPRPEPPVSVHGTVARNATLAALLDAHLSRAAVQELVGAAQPAYDLRRIDVGRPWSLTTSPEGRLLSFRYAIDGLRTLEVTRGDGGLAARVEARSYDTRTATVSGVVRSSLFLAVTEAGEDDQLALDLAEIFASDVDFNTEVQKGDSFAVAVEKHFLDGRFAGYGQILAARFRRGTRGLEAVGYQPRGARFGYYAPDGTPTRKTFLRSPLKFTRISSGFTQARFHPLLHAFTTHLGIDYAAAIGTPVQAAAAGVVTSAGWDGGYGLAVEVRHRGGFDTLYGHLSRIDVRAGQRVDQGDRVGAVGTTGLSTGPHLHYRMLRDDVHVNPLTVQLPPAEPIAPDERDDFAAARETKLALIRATPAPSPAVAAALPGRASQPEYHPKR